uniref:hypothetical protein n=1 Tax=Vibrio cholerae TaxID=666 RepID=UPI003F588DFD
MKLRPLHDWVIIKRDKPLESLLWVPDKPGNTGEVVAIGAEVVEVNVGSKSNSILMRVLMLLLLAILGCLSMKLRYRLY